MRPPAISSARRENTRLVNPAAGLMVAEQMLTDQSQQQRPCRPCPFTFAGRRRLGIIPLGGRPTPGVSCRAERPANNRYHPLAHANPVFSPRPTAPQFVPRLNEGAGRVTAGRQVPRHGLSHAAVVAHQHMAGGQSDGTSAKPNHNRQSVLLGFCWGGTRPERLLRASVT
uniref:Uncharacterized protein n=1 Tax=Plectus sambesii TaxID=2011161 RepID=A0A914X8C5_9BILA